jgi:transposase-like protein
MSPFSTECVAEFECIFEYDTMHPTTPRVERLARKHGLTGAQVRSWFGYRRRKALKRGASPASTTAVENHQDANVLPARGSRYAGQLAYSVYTPEQLVELEMADEADGEFMEMLMSCK